MTPEKLDTHNKALAINLDPSIFGSFAEIGAGQETARWFLRVGAASGTVAKTICAYDKAVSDDLYGSGSRYVSKQRLAAMLNAEWSHLEKQILERPDTRAFVFANTIAARNYAGTNQCHGWLGIQFQTQLSAAPNRILLHVNLLDPTNVLQQESLGILGVNLIYAAYHQRATVETFLAGLGDDLGLDHLEIDFVETHGELFQNWDPLHLFAALVSSDLAAGVVLPHSGEYLPLNEVLYKIPVVLEPGRFEAHEPIHSGMLAAGIAQLASSRKPGERTPRAFFCVSPTPDNAEPPLKRAENLLRQGYDVLLTRHFDMYKISAQLRDFTPEPIRFVIGLSVLVRLIEASYSELHGQILEGLGRLFTEDVRVYVHPMSGAVLRKRLPVSFLEGWTIPNSDDLIEAGQISPPVPLGFLYNYLLACQLIEPLRDATMRTHAEE